MESNEVTPLVKTRKKRISKILLAVVITAVISVFISFLSFYLIFLGSDRNIKLSELDFIVDNYFYGDVDVQQVNDYLLKGYVEGLGDRFSAYYNKEDTKKRTDSLNGSAQGIGVIISKCPDTNYIYVKHVYSGSPAEKAGILEKDLIYAIDSVSVVESGYAEAVNSIIRETGEMVNLSILRGNEKIDVSVEFSEFKAQSVFWEITEDNIGYMKITSFNNETVVQFKNAINQLTKEGVKGLIFDLRGNGGGTVSSVNDMLDILCPEGTLMTVKYSNGKESVMAKSDKDEINLPMAVLIDGSTASASELFAANIKDFKKGVTVGSKTFGKGVMQTTYNLTDGSSVAITVAEFFSHSGISFNKEGIEPDISVELSETQLKYYHQLSLDEDSVIVAAADYINELCK